MADVVISADKLGKSYTLPSADAGHTTLAEVALHRLRHPLRRRRREILEALRDVTFDVGAGEVVGIIGRNGAGKSTLLKVLSRITEPSSGEVRLQGRVGCLLEVGTGFHPELTGRENIFLNGAVLGMKRPEIVRQFNAIVEFAGIGRFLDLPVKRYSSGMSVRLAFAVAAHLEPEIIVVDEVLAVGDAEFQKRCLNKMSEVASADARTVLFVSHNMAAIESLCSRVIVLDQGRIQFDGPASEGVAHYLATSAQLGGSGEAELGQRAGRHGAKAIIQRVAVRGGGLQAAGTVRSGESATITVELEGLAELPVSIVGVELRSELDQRLATWHTHMKPARHVPERRDGREEVVMELASLPVMPGRYWIDVGVWDGGNRRLADRVDRAVSFDVVTANVYRSGYEPKHAEGTLTIDFDWELRPAPPPAANPQETTPLREAR